MKRQSYSIIALTKKTLIIYAALGLTLTLLIVYLVNALYKPSAIKTYNWSQVQANSKDELEIIIWNLGYGGLGKESNFVMDGGEDWRPPSEAAVKKNVSGIMSFLEFNNPDVFLFQEIAKPSFLTYGIDVLKSVKTTLLNYKYIYIPDFRTQLIPAPYNVNSGLSVFAKPGLISSSESRLLPLEARRYGAFRKHYQMVVNYIPSSIKGKKWVVINIHLAAFDSNADVRSEQLKVIRSFAINQYECGNLVVIGGDWNLRLAKTEFLHKTEKKYLFWVNDLPKDAFPEKWKVVVDTNIPTVRTLQKAYVPNENYVTIIDGFITSPNVETKFIESIDLGFIYSDHNPVKAKFFAISKPN